MRRSPGSNVLGRLPRPLQNQPGGGAATALCHRFEAGDRGDNAADTRSDTMHGIPEAYLDCVSAPFFTTRAVGQGTGLSPSVTFGILANHHGTITVQSAAGLEMTFTICLLFLSTILRREDAPAP